MFNLQQLKILVLLAEHKKLTVVAGLLNIKQPSVTFHMKKLEQAAGVPLFIQRHKLIFLTEEGKALHHFASRIVSWTEEAQQVLSDYAHFKKGKIIVGSSNTPATYFLPKLLGKMREVYPEVNIIVQVKNSPQIVDMVKKFEIDFGLVAENKIVDPDLVITPLVNDELGLVVYPGHRLADVEKIGPEHLQNEYWILRDQDSSSRRMMEVWAGQQLIESKGDIELGTTEAIKRAVICRLGISLLSRLAVEDEVRNGQLIYKSLDSGLLSRGIFFIYNKNRFMTPIVEEFIGFFESMRF
ncbi:LysR substrate-binding domain-containing protein [Paenibacillus filicis]|uniref:LysR substrate-binding domain-containing protein n=1 Tax=Paenibacillus gyeongsangnamensis TaxID=3388067 RepID=A0ABT4Q423_9BACL|nr:LysR substrate-binding domain-containing protein [Paenibacillus filicis]MCZ8511537.1 LysR substrate-binding domain-containing protein [Paenibacillus filicis]